MLIGEDIGAAGGVFKATEGLFERFGPTRIWDTPISEQAIIGAVMGAAMNGLRPVAEIMFSDFFAVCWDLIANQIAKTRYMTNGQVSLPLVIRTANGVSLDYTKGELVYDNVEAFKYLDNSSVTFVPCVEPDNPQHIVAYHTSGDALFTTGKIGTRIIG